MSEIKDIRVHLGLTQAEMAERLGITQPTLSRLESGIIAANKRTLLAAHSLKAMPRPAKTEERAA